MRLPLNLHGGVYLQLFESVGQKQPATLYEQSGGLRSVAWVDALQCILLILGIIVLGMFVLHSAGGWKRWQRNSVAARGHPS